VPNTMLDACVRRSAQTLPSHRLFRLERARMPLRRLVHARVGESGQLRHTILPVRGRRSPFQDRPERFRPPRPGEDSRRRQPATGVPALLARLGPRQRTLRRPRPRTRRDSARSTLRESREPGSSAGQHRSQAQHCRQAPQGSELGPPDRVLMALRGALLDRRHDGVRCASPPGGRRDILRLLASAGLGLLAQGREAPVVGAQSGHSLRSGSEAPPVGGGSGGTGRESRFSRKRPVADHLGFGLARPTEDGGPPARAAVSDHACSPHQDERDMTLDAKANGVGRGAGPVGGFPAPPSSSRQSGHVSGNEA
jgi:hypothetical protein